MLPRPRPSAIAFLLLPFLAAAGAAQPQVSPPVRTEAPPLLPPSPRLAGLAWQLAQGDRAALERFWAEIDRHGTPLLEAVPAGAEGGPSLLLTFLWRGTAERAVVLLGTIGQDAPLVRLDGTDVWYRTYRLRRDLRFTYRLAPVRGAIPLDPTAPGYDREKIRATAQVDPRNPHRYPPTGPPLLSLVEMPEAPPQPWVGVRKGVPAGRVERGSLKSLRLAGVREVAVYTPAGYLGGRGDRAPYPLLVVFDGSAYLDLLPLPRMLDNLRAAGALPAVVAVFVGRLEAVERDRDLSCFSPFTAFLAEELLPWVRSRYRVTTDPARTVLVGSSRGGLATACAALDHPELFGNVLAQSGSFPWRPPGDPAPEWLRRRVLSLPRLPLRFHLDVGLLETQLPPQGGPSLLDASRRLYDALQVKGYAVDYAEYAGGHGHVNWQGTLPDGLRALLGQR
ncbi:MAG TPA: alpha/beta hydrolase-fold protein [Thermoanaerobaculia bacterium]|nr:alpha/beta hydrolase-fold protein [Thermoanaerobaculia bacterium]